MKIMVRNVLVYIVIVVLWIAIFFTGVIAEVKPNVLSDDLSFAVLNEEALVVHSSTRVEITFHSDFVISGPYGYILSDKEERPPGWKYEEFYVIDEILHPGIYTNLIDEELYLIVFSPDGNVSIEQTTEQKRSIIIAIALICICLLFFSVFIAYTYQD